MKVQISFVIGPAGQVKADVVGGQGTACITEILGPLEELLGEATDTKFKPEYAVDEEALRLIQKQQVGS